MPKTTDFPPLAAPEAPDRWHPRIRALYDYWAGLRPGGTLLPGRQHLDPIDIPALLPWVWLFDVQRQPLRFRVRLLGTKHYEQMLRDPTGRWVDEAYPSFASQTTYPDYLKVAVEGRISYRKGPPAYHVDSGCSLLERIMLPLARDGRSVDMILGLTLYFRADGEIY
ncbi:MAG: PAS domain-containing protein [Tistlia sp.]|uniref:PAS domain-containing protein n=1 Tax=Tistlia sp. TaxID=3057121 RepID=UPI0034A32844